MTCLLYTSIFGLPVLVSLCGEGSNTGAVALVIAVVVPMFNALSVTALEIYRGGKPNPLKILKSVATNPLILASLLGIVLLLLGVKLPNFLQKPVADLSKMATPLALVILGAEFNFGQVRKCVRQLVIGVSGRLVVMPLIFLTIAVLLGFRGEELIALLVMLAAPPAVSSFTMAQQMDGEDVYKRQSRPRSCLYNASFFLLMKVRQNDRLVHGQQQNVFFLHFMDEICGIRRVFGKHAVVRGNGQMNLQCASQVGGLPVIHVAPAAVDAGHEHVG